MGLRRKRLIITDDDQIFLMQMCGLLMKMGLSVIPADNGAELLKLVSLQRPDMIILDINMPLLDGPKTLRFLKEDAATADIPVLVVSSDNSKKTVDEVLGLGAHGFLGKPVDLRRLHALMEETLFARENRLRNYIRTSYSGMVTLRHEGSTRTYPTETISEKGVFLITPSPLPVGTGVEVTLSLGDKSSVALMGSVIYHQGMAGFADADTHGMAIEFTQGSEEDFRSLSGFVKGLLIRDVEKYKKGSFI